MVVGTLKISLDQRKKKKKRSLVECCSVSSCESMKELYMSGCSAEVNENINLGYSQDQGYS